jgi:hypothetical protein
VTTEPSLSPIGWNYGFEADSFPRVTRPPLDPVRGTEAARKLKDLRAKRILIRAAELGYITEVTSGMHECFCPEDLGGRRYFEPVSAELSDWSPTHEHFPVPKREGGKASPDNTILAHRLCNRIDYSKAVGRSHRRDLERIRKAREAADAANVSSDENQRIESATTELRLPPTTLERQCARAGEFPLPPPLRLTHLIRTP